MIYVQVRGNTERAQESKPASCSNRKGDSSKYNNKQDQSSLPQQLTPFLEKEPSANMM